MVPPPSPSNGTPTVLYTTVLRESICQENSTEVQREKRLTAFECHWSKGHPEITHKIKILVSRSPPCSCFILVRWGSKKWEEYDTAVNVTAKMITMSKGCTLRTQNYPQWWHSSEPASPSLKGQLGLSHHLLLKLQFLSHGTHKLMGAQFEHIIFCPNSDKLTLTLLC